MADHDPHDAITETIEPVTATMTLPSFGGGDFGDVGAEDLGDEQWPAQSAKRGLRLRTPTAILVGVLLLAGGFWGGTYLQKNEGSTGTAGAVARFAALGRSGAGGSGTGRSGAASPFGSGTSTATIGTVTDIIGNTLYVTTSSGSLVKVTLSSSATVSRNADSSLGALKAGDSVVVQGTTAKDGAMTASSVAATAAGVSSGGFGGGGGAGGGGGFGGGAGGAGGAAGSSSSASGS